MFWIGSGVSIGVVKGLDHVVESVMEFLRARSDPSDNSCRFSRALNDALNLAGISDAERGRIDLSTPFPSWPDANLLKRRLVDRYSQLLEIQVAEEEDDYLLWEAARVTETYAASGVEPDVEHLCVALLVMEGTAPNLVSANWDGFIEAAVQSLSGARQALTVCVRPEDLREAPGRARLFKFHGCAVLAAQSPAEYRKFLVARQSQINGWVSRGENAPIVNRLTGLTTENPTLMLGLSAQDTNIQAIFTRADSVMPWQWPGERPAFVFSVESLSEGHKSILKNVYRNAYQAGTRDAIHESARLRVYAKQLLVALVLSVTCEKLQTLAALVPTGMSPAELQLLQEGILKLRDQAAGSAGSDLREFVLQFVARSRLGLAVFRSGRAAVAGPRYAPLVPTPIQVIPTESIIHDSPVRQFAAFLGLLGRGVDNRFWRLECGLAAPNEPQLCWLISGTSRIRVIVVEGDSQALLLGSDGHLDSAEGRTVVVHGRARVPNASRSPRPALGRTGQTGVEEVSLDSLLREASSADELIQMFREEIAA